MKFRKNVPAMKKAFTTAFRGIDVAGTNMIEQLDIDFWQSPAMMCSRLATAGILPVHSSTAYDEALQIVTAFVGAKRSVKWAKENEGKILVAYVGDRVQLEIMIKPHSKRQQMLVRFQPVIANTIHEYVTPVVIRKNSVTCQPVAYLRKHVM